MLDRLIGLLDRHARSVTLIAALWFWTGIAVYARIIELPDMPELVKDAFFWGSVGANAGWWGFLRPRIEMRREQLAARVKSEE